jgi:hypothetical protein
LVSFVAYIRERPRNFDFLITEGHNLDHLIRRRWEDNIKIDLREIGWGGMDWRALVSTVMKVPIQQNFGKFLSGYATGGFSRRAQLHGVS